MNQINEKLNKLKENKQNDIKIMILGLGSVGGYLLQYLCELKDPSLQLIVVGRSYEKMEKDVNIISIAASIRGCLKSKIIIESNCDFEDTVSIKLCLEKYVPDIIVNTSRVYPGLKYGSISWEKFRAYGIWTPLAIKYIRNIMKAYSLAQSQSIVINTSYSDAVIPWLKSAGMEYPDFGSGNINHLIPRLKRAAAQYLNVEDFWNIDVIMATGHFHDVVISKEGQNEGVSQLIHICYREKNVYINENILLKLCKIAMPTNEKRNMMNASSNFEIILAILKAVREGAKVRIHSPGVMGNIGGYPVYIDGTGKLLDVYLDETYFLFDEMLIKNKQSLRLDGIDEIRDGCLYYTDKLVSSVKKEFHIELPKMISFEEIDNTADFLIANIINKS